MKREDIIIEADELLAKLGDPNLRIYDATIRFFDTESELSAYETYEQGHIPGAAFFEHHDFSDMNGKYMYTLAPQAQLASGIGNIGISADTEVVFYTTGAFPCATRAWWLLYYAGHDNVRVLNGGLDAWQKAGGQIEQTVRHYASATFEGQFRPSMFADKEEVLAAMENGGACIVYTLPPNMYGGAYIPNSAFTSALSLLHAMDVLLPDEQILPYLAETAQHERIITYCGGGIAATINAIGYLIAGHENVAVYDGSLSEWMGEGLPIAKHENA